jgi:hypothetical protein
MYLYALYHSKPLPKSLQSALPCDHGSFGVDSRLLIFDSSQGFEAVGKLIKQHMSPGGSCPFLLLPISTGHIFCGSPQACNWIKDHSV